MAIWVTSDLHLNDPSVLVHSGSAFNSLEEYNDYVIQHYNEIVKKDDLVYILGDVGFKPKEKLAVLISKLKGRKILIIGNHDQLSDSEYREMGFIQVIRHPFYYSDNIILSHYPVKEAYRNKFVINLHGHLHKHILHLDNYYNVNVDLHDYKPLNLKEIAEQVKKTYPKDRFEPFGQEWYAKYEKLF